MERIRELSLVEKLSSLWIVRPRNSVDTLNLSQRAETQSEPPSLVDINGELDLIKTSPHVFPRTDRETGIDYFELYASSRQLKGLSEATMSGLDFNGRNGDVLLTFAYDIGIARKISIQRRDKIASFFIPTDPSRHETYLNETRRKEIPLTAEDALLVAKLGRKLAKV